MADVKLIKISNAKKLENIEKQRILRRLGHTKDVKESGSWGPYQQKLWEGLTGTNRTYADAELKKYRSEYRKETLNKLKDYGILNESNLNNNKELEKIIYKFFPEDSGNDYDQDWAYTFRNGTNINKSNVKESTNINLKLKKNNKLSDYDWSIEHTGSTPDIKNDKYVKEYFKYDVAPRLKKYNKDEYGTLVSNGQDSIVSNIYRDTPIMQVEYPKENKYTGGETFWKYNLDFDPNSYSPLTKTEKENMNKFKKNQSPTFIILNNRYKQSSNTVVHELNHALRNALSTYDGGYPFDNDVIYHWNDQNPKYFRSDEFSTKYLNNNYNKEVLSLVPKHGIVESYSSGYSSPEIKALFEGYPGYVNGEYTGDKFNDAEVNIDTVTELGSTNSEVRFRLWKALYQLKGRRPTMLELNNFIDKYDDEKLKEIIYKANDYGYDSVKSGLIDTKKTKKALKTVAQAGRNNRVIYTAF